MVRSPLPSAVSVKLALPASWPLRNVKGHRGVAAVVAWHHTRPEGHRLSAPDAFGAYVLTEILTCPVATNERSALRRFHLRHQRREDVEGTHRKRQLAIEVRERV